MSIETQSATIKETDLVGGLIELPSKEFAAMALKSAMGDYREAVNKSIHNKDLSEIRPLAAARTAANIKVNKAKEENSYS